MDEKKTKKYIPFRSRGGGGGLDTSGSTTKKMYVFHKAIQNAVYRLTQHILMPCIAFLLLLLGIPTILEKASIKAKRIVVACLLSSDPLPLHRKPFLEDTRKKTLLCISAWTKTQNFVIILCFATSFSFFHANMSQKDIIDDFFVFSSSLLLYPFLIKIKTW